MNIYKRDGKKFSKSILKINPLIHCIALQAFIQLFSEHYDLKFLLFNSQT